MAAKRRFFAFVGKSCGALLFILQSCSNNLGYGIILWSEANSEAMKGLSNGQIVTIIGQSKVSDSYSISFQNTERSIPTSRIAFFRHLSNARKYREQFIKYRDWYAVNMKPGGLIIRSAADRKAEQVYRLRPRQTMKILYQASEQITLGNIQGHWYEVLTEDGARGFAFDYYLRIEDHSKPIARQVIKLAAFEQSRDKLNINLHSLEGIWYQKKYTQLLHSGQSIDLRLLMLPYGQLYLNQEDKQLELYLDDTRQISQILPYDPDKIAIDSSFELDFNDSQVRVIFIKADEISFYFRNQNGIETILELQKMAKEELQRYQKKALNQRKIALSSIFLNGSQFSAAGLYGSIRFQSDGQFFWSNTSALVDEGVLQNASNKGTLFFPYRLGPNLRGNYAQLLTFVFDDNQELTFLLQINRDSSVRLRYVPPFMIDNKGILNSDAFNEKLDIQMQLEGRPIIPIDLF